MAVPCGIRGLDLDRHVDRAEIEIQSDLECAPFPNPCFGTEQPDVPIRAVFKLDKKLGFLAGCRLDQRTLAVTPLALPL